MHKHEHIYIYIYIYTHTHTHTHTHTEGWMNRHWSMLEPIFICSSFKLPSICMFAGMYAFICVCVCIYIYMYGYIFIHRYWRMHACMCIYTHVNVHISACAIYTCTHVSTCRTQAWCIPTHIYRHTHGAIAHKITYVHTCKHTQILAFQTKTQCSDDSTPGHLYSTHVQLCRHLHSRDTGCRVTILHYELPFLHDSPKPWLAVPKKPPTIEQSHRHLHWRCIYRHETAQCCIQHPHATQVWASG
jgi:hypothetical protein